MSDVKKKIKDWKRYKREVDDYIDACQDYSEQALDEGPGSNPPTPPPPPPPVFENGEG